MNIYNLTVVISWSFYRRIFICRSKKRGEKEEKKRRKRGEFCLFFDLAPTVAQTGEEREREREGESKKRAVAWRGSGEKS